MKKFPLIIGMCILQLLLGCSRSKIGSSGTGISSVRYDSRFPDRNGSVELEQIAQSVKKIYSVSSYTTYQFKPEMKITSSNVHDGTFRKSAWGVISTSETAFGTATIVGYSESKVMLITCAHIVNAPDTLISYFESTADGYARYIQSVSIREKQENWIRDLSSCGPFQVLAIDQETDIAILGKHCESLAEKVIPFTCPVGRASDLGWGSFVYILGYPMGNQVITKGIATPSAKRPMGEFYIDALLNKGYSGGIILALRNGVPNFELVGMVKSVTANREEFLKPASGYGRVPDWLPYTGEVFIGKSDNIQYGMNEIVPIETMLRFYDNHSQELIRGGYRFDFVPRK